MTGTVKPVHYAARYARTGTLAVLPLHWISEDGRCSCRHADCRSQGKHPLTRNGKDDATTDLDVITSWWRRWPRANVGVRPPRGVVVVDEDPRDGGDVALADLEQRHAPLPVTLTAATGSGGRHLWFTYAGPVPGRLAAGVDLKTHTGYLVAPPSRHVSGGTYRWTTEVPAASAPEWLRQRLNPPRPPRTAGPVVNRRSVGGLGPLVRWVAAAGNGERHTRLRWAALRAFEQGLDPGPLRTAGLDLELSEHEVDTVIGWAASAPPRAGGARR